MRYDYGPISGRAATWNAPTEEVNLSPAVASAATRTRGVNRLDQQPTGAAIAHAAACQPSPIQQLGEQPLGVSRNPLRKLGVHLGDDIL
jgi:predicted NAD/FAD-binding protein